MTTALLFATLHSMKTVTVSGKNQVVIPKEVRKKLRITGGDKLIVKSITNTEVVLGKQPSYHDFLGIARCQKQDPVQVVREMRDNWK